MKNIRNIIIIAVMAWSAASCLKEENQPNIEQTPSANLVEISITAGTESDESKAAFDSENYPAIIWTGNDEISILGANTGNSKFTTSSTCTTATFTGLADLSDEVLYAVYPYDAEVAIPTTDKDKGTNKDAELIKVTIPSVQTATANSFDPKAFVAVAKSTDKNFTFRGIGAFMKFRLDKPEKVKSVTVVAHNDANDKSVTIAAGSGVKFLDNGSPTHGLGGTWVNGTSSNTIKLVESPIGDQFEKDTDYFIVTRANNCPNGVTIQIEYDNGEVFSTRSTTKTIFPNGARNHIADLGTIDNLPTECLDFSYAGYMHGEVEPSYAGYTRYDVAEYKKGTMTDRQAFLAALTAAFGTPVNEYDSKNDQWWITFNQNSKGPAEIYFPEGEWILHDETDDVTHDGKKYSQSIVIRGNNIVIKGAGRDKTILMMNAPMQPKDPNDLYSSPDMIQLKHNSGLGTRGTGHMVTGSLAAKGSFSLEVESAEGLSEGDWVSLYILNNYPEFVNKELAPYSPESDWIIYKKGVEVYDYHQIKSIEGNTITFYEPLMHEVNPDEGVKATERWEIRKFNHYENIGVEDLTFVGKAVEDFKHHQDWNHDGGYKPLSMNRVVNSWIRRVDFVSTSEACSIIGSANVSAYDINMRGNRGHAAIRSQASSRVLIAYTKDETSNGLGNWHGVGVSKHSIGTVLLRNIWGNDSCFESHANQPRATLIDCCEGGWMRGHMGGNAEEAPHHLADLTIWNFTATSGDAGEFEWWDQNVTNWRFLKPYIYGFQSGFDITFPTEEVMIDKMHGTQIGPESLYESQLQNRGFNATWLKYTK